MGNRHFAPAPLGGSALGDGPMADAKTSVSKEEDALIKKRLLTQTTTARQGADPPVKRLVKKYLAFCGSLSGEGASADEVEKHKESFLKELALYEFQLGRTAAVTAANEREMASYAEARGEVDEAVVTVHSSYAGSSFVRQGNIPLDGRDCRRFTYHGMQP